MTCIQKLKSTWKSISKKHLALVKEIDRIFDSRGNFKNYRGILRSLEPPVIPFEVSSRYKALILPYIGPTPKRCHVHIRE